MKLQSYNIFPLCLFLLLLFFSSAQGQEVQLSFSEEQVITSNGALVSTHVRIYNPTSETIISNLVLSAEEDALRIISSGEREIDLAPSDSLFISVRVMVSSEVRAGENYPLQARLVSGDTEMTSASLPISIRQINMLKMSVLEEQLLYDERGDTLRIPVRIRNSGNTRQTFQLLSRYAFEKNNDELESQQLQLEPFADTTVVINRNVDREILNLDNFNIYLKGLYSSGDIFGSGSINASSVKNNRRYSTPVDPYNLNSMRRNNIVSLSTQSTRGNMQYFFYANNDVTLPNGTLQSNFDVNWWENNDRVMLRNSWLSYDTKDYGIKAGNIFRTGDVNLIGRGVEAYYKPASNRVIEIGGIDRSYDLLGTYNSNFGKAGWIRFSEDGGWMQNGYEGSIIYEDEPRTNERNVLASGKTSIVNNKDLRIRAGLAASNATLYSNAGTSRSGGAGEMSFFVRDGDISVNGDYFFSSGHYTGLRKGAMHINQRVNYQRERTSFWVGYNLLNYQPERLSAAQYTGSSFSTDRYSIGTSRRFNRFSVSLSPNYYEERRKNRSISSDDAGQAYKMNASRLSVGLNYSEPFTRQSISLNLEGGYSGTNLGDQREPHYKASFNYNWKFFNLSAFYQYNHFYVSELISSSRYGSDATYTRSNIMPSLQHSFFDDKLHLRAGLSYSRHSFSDDFMQVSGRADYSLPYNFNVFVSTFYSDFSSYYYDSSTLRFGVSKRFGTINLKDQKHRLEVFVYYDDQEEIDKARPAAGEMVLINNKVFRTDDKGVVTYDGLPEATYKVRMFNTNEWYAPEREVTLGQNTKIVIGMNRTVSVIGNVAWVFTEASFEVEKKMLGHRIVFTSTDGQQYTARTDDRGNFRIYIPDGIYTVSFDESRLSDLVEVQENNRLMEVERGEENTLEFDLKVRERRIERQRFESQPFQREQD